MYYYILITSASACTLTLSRVHYYAGRDPIGRPSDNRYLRVYTRISACRGAHYAIFRRRRPTELRGCSRRGTANWHWDTTPPRTPPIVSSVRMHILHIIIRIVGV